MALKDLSAPTMIQISQAWLEVHRSLLESMPLVWGIIPSLEKAHAALVEVEEHETSGLVELTQLEHEAGRIDHRHDRKARGVFDALSAFALIADDSGQAAKLLNLRDRIFPEGKGITLKSYAEEAQEVVEVKDRIGEDDLAFLAALPVLDTDLSSVFQDWITTGEQLGALEARRATLEASHDTSAVESVIEARNAWIRAARGLTTMLELEEADEATRQTLLGDLRKAEVEAESQ